MRAKRINEIEKEMGQKYKTRFKTLQTRLTAQKVLISKLAQRVKALEDQIAGARADESI